MAILSEQFHVSSTLLSIAALALSYLLIFLPIYNVFLHPLRSYPGPKLWGASVLPWTLMFLSGKTHKKLLELHDQYGEVVRVAPNELSFIAPEAWEDVMGYPKQGVRKENPKASWYCSPRNKDIIGASWSDHVRMRRLIVNGFSAGSMLQQQPLIKGYVDLLIQKLREKVDQGNPVVDLHAWYNYCTFDIIGHLSLGEPFGCLKEEALHPWINLIFANIRLTALVLVFMRTPVFLLFAPFFISFKLVKQFREHQEISRQLVKKRLELGEARADFVQDMIDGKGNLTVSHEELTNNAVILTLAGSETTATSLAGATYLIAQHPDVEAKILDELHQTFGNEDEIDLLSVAKLPYLCAVTEECLRMYPPGPNTQPRITPPEGNVIVGRMVPGNTVLGLPHQAMYLSDRNFTRAKEFLPERWLGHGKGGEFVDDRRDAFHPFSYGPRNCIGMNLAYAELRLILARMLWNFRVELAPASREWMEQQNSYLLWHKPALMCKLTSR